MTTRNSKFTHVVVIWLSAHNIYVYKFQDSHQVPNRSRVLKICRTTRDNRNYRGENQPRLLRALRALPNFDYWFEHATYDVYTHTDDVSAAEEKNHLIDGYRLRNNVTVINSYRANATRGEGL